MLIWATVVVEVIFACVGVGVGFVLSLCEFRGKGRKSWREMKIKFLDGKKVGLYTLGEEGLNRQDATVRQLLWFWFGSGSGALVDANGTH